MKIVFAHNSLSAYPVSNILGRVFNFTAKCQSKDIKGLWDAGVRGFDLRFCINKGKIRVCHGLVDYKVDIYKVLELIKTLNINEETICIRIIHEDTFHASSRQEFMKEVENIMKKYPEFKYIVYSSKKDWKLELREIRLSEYEFCNSTLIPWLTPILFSNRRMNNMYRRLMDRISSGAFYFDFI